MATTTRETKTFENVVINAINSGAAYGGSIRRLEFALKDCVFPAFDKEGHETSASQFSVDVTKVNGAIDDLYFKLITAKAMGRTIKAEIYGLLLQNAEITFTRSLYKKGETRNERTFEKDTWVTDITKFVLHTPELFKQELQRMISANEIYDVPNTKAMNVNFFNV